MARKHSTSPGCGILIGVCLCIAGAAGGGLYLINTGRATALISALASPAPSPAITATLPAADALDVLPGSVPTLAAGTPVSTRIAVTSAPFIASTLAPGAVPYLAVVKVSAISDGKEAWNGSGTIITPDGLILTNAHVVLPEKPYTVESLVISLTEKDDRSPVPRYQAEVYQADPDMDIAVLRITRDLDGNSVDGSTLDLPVVPLGNSDELELGAPLLILGYPTIGGDTITLTRGDVAGFTADPKYGDRAFVKTSATITGGNSGGLAANDRGELVGVPTQLGYGGEGELVDCRPLADTNRDGVVNEYDNCIPTGGFINALRPINLALPLIEAAKRGEISVGKSYARQSEMPDSGEVLFREDFSNPASGWDERRGPSGSARYADGVYRVQVRLPQTFVWGRANQQFDDVIVKVNVIPQRGYGDEDFGVICRYVDEQNFYALEVSLDGYYTIWKVEGGERTSLVDWQRSANLPTGGEPLTLTVGCLQEGLALAANKELIAQVSDPGSALTARQGDIGLIAGTWQYAGAVIDFDDLVVYQP